MKKNTTEIIILNNEENKKYNNLFDIEKEKFDKKIYVSYYEEKARIVSMICKKKIKCRFNQAREIIFKRLVKQLHPELEISDLKINCFYRTGGKSGKNIFKVTELTEEQIDIEWFSNEQNFIKSFRVTPSIFNKKKTVIRYLSYVKGMKSIESNFEKRIKNVYLKRDKIAFEIDIINIKIELKIIKDNKKEKYKKKIERMIKYSKNLY